MIDGMLHMAIFLFCGQFLVLFRPGEKYDKYFKLLVNLMICLLFIVPFVSALAEDPIYDGEAWLERFLEEMDKRLDDIELKYSTEIEGSDEDVKREEDVYAQGGIRVLIGPVEIEEVEVEMEEKE